jgi:hypothetical protein
MDYPIKQRFAVLPRTYSETPSKWKISPSENVIVTAKKSLIVWGEERSSVKEEYYNEPHTVIQSVGDAERTGVLHYTQDAKSVFVRAGGTFSNRRSRIICDYFGSLGEETWSPNITTVALIENIETIAATLRNGKCAKNIPYTIESKLYEKNGARQESILRITAKAKNCAIQIDNEKKACLTIRYEKSITIAPFTDRREQKKRFFLKAKENISSVLATYFPEVSILE